METVSIARLKASLSHYLRIVRNGEEVLVTDRGDPIARIVPLKKDEEAFSPHLRELERAGLIRRGTRKLPEDFWKYPRVRCVKGSALKALLDEREEGR